MEEQIPAIKQELTYNKRDSGREAIRGCESFQPKLQKVSTDNTPSVSHSKQKRKKENEKVLQNHICRKCKMFYAKLAK